MTVIFTKSVSVHPFDATTTTRYCVFNVGLTNGLFKVLVIVLDGGTLHNTPLIVAPPVGGGVAVGVPPMVVLSLKHITLSAPASAIGFRFTFTSTVICMLVAHPFTVAVNVYSISNGGVLNGLATVLLFKNKFGVHWKLDPGVTWAGSFGLGPICTVPP